MTTIVLLTIASLKDNDGILLFSCVSISNTYPNQSVGWLVYSSRGNQEVAYCVKTSDWSRSPAQLSPAPPLKLGGSSMELLECFSHFGFPLRKSKVVFDLGTHIGVYSAIPTAFKNNSAASSTQVIDSPPGLSAHKQW